MQLAIRRRASRMSGLSLRFEKLCASAYSLLPVGDGQRNRSFVAKESRHLEHFCVVEMETPFESFAGDEEQQQGFVCHVPFQRPCFWAANDSQRAIATLARQRDLLNFRQDLHQRFETRGGKFKLYRLSLVVRQAQAETRPILGHLESGASLALNHFLHYFSRPSPPSRR